MSIFKKPFFMSKDKKVEELYSSGVMSLQDNDFYRANELFKSAASQGHVSALYNLSLLNGSGMISPIEIDFAIDCFRQAALKGHPNAKEYSTWIDKAEDTSFGTVALAMFASKLNNQAAPNHLLTMIGCKLYDALCKKYGATDEVIAYELDAASQSDYDFIHKFIKRTGISSTFYENGLDRLTTGSAADQITDGLNNLYVSMKQSGQIDHACLLIRCTIVGYIISKSQYSRGSQPLLGLDKFFD